MRIIAAVVNEQEETKLTEELESFSVFDVAPFIDLASIGGFSLKGDFNGDGESIYLTSPRSLTLSQVVSLELNGSQHAHASEGMAPGNCRRDSCVRSLQISCLENDKTKMPGKEWVIRPACHVLAGVPCPRLRGRVWVPFTGKPDTVPKPLSA